MAIAQTLINYLQERSIDYDLVEHPHTETARESAKSSHLPAHQVAKSVLLKDEAGYVVSVIPASHQLAVEWVNEKLDRNLTIAKEKELKAVFADCESGAVPALGEAYGLEVIWDDDLQYTSDVYIEAGDHEHLIWLERRDFRSLMKSLPHTVISKDKEVGGWKQ
jgi:Ala-tRNA(Pro) deacylase